jgi:hypothetical protein
MMYHSPLSLEGEGSTPWLPHHLMTKWRGGGQVGPWEPTAELAQTLISDANVDIIKNHTRALVQKYWERLVAKGVPEKEYPFERCWDDFCRAGTEKWLWMFGE